MASSVLIVDDSSLMRQAVAKLFADGGFEVCGAAESGQEAIDKAQLLNPGLIVMDFSMPLMNGIEAARCLRHLLPRVPIVILSDYGGLLPDQEARSAGIDAIISKAECSSVLLYEARMLCKTAA